MTIDNAVLKGKRDEAARAFIRRLVDGEFEGNVLRASKALGLSNSVLYEVLKGTRGVGMVVLDALKAHTGQSIAAILGEAGPPDLAAIPTEALAAEIERRGMRAVASEYAQTIDHARAEGAETARKHRYTCDVCGKRAMYEQCGTRLTCEEHVYREEGWWLIDESTAKHIAWDQVEITHMIADAVAKEREACAARLEESARLLDALAAECAEGSESRRIYKTQADVVRAAIDAIRARKDGPT